MTDGRSNSGRDRDSVLTPEDQSLLGELLPQDDRSGPARRRPQATSEAMVQAVLDAVLAAQETTQPMEDLRAASGAKGSTSRLGSRSGRRALVLFAASLAVFSAGALAASVVRVVLAPKPAPAAVRTTRALPTRPVAEAPVVEEEPEVVVEPEPEVVPIEAARTVAKVRPPRRKRPHASPRVAAKEHLLAEVDLASAPLEDLLALANKLRGSREWRPADEVYGAVMDRFPGSDAAVVAQTVSATLRIEHLKDARGALDGYRRALAARPTGPLAEEARWGIAAALRSLGDRDGELKALHEFLDRHADSALAPAARRRVAELGQ